MNTTKTRGGFLKTFLPLCLAKIGYGRHKFGAKFLVRKSTHKYQMSIST